MPCTNAITHGAERLNSGEAEFPRCGRGFGGLVSSLLEDMSLFTAGKPWISGGDGDDPPPGGLGAAALRSSLCAGKA